MTTSTNSLNLTVSFDKTADLYLWEVLDADGDQLDCFVTRAEAEAFVAAECDEAEKTEIISDIMPGSINGESTRCDS